MNQESRAQGAQQEAQQPGAQQEGAQRQDLISKINPWGAYRPTSSLLDSIIQIFETDYPDELLEKLPFTTSGKPALSRLSPGMNTRLLDDIEFVILLQSYSPEEITPELILHIEEMKKESFYNSASAENGLVLRTATGSIHVVEQSQTHKFIDEDGGGGRGPFGIFGRKKRS